MYHLKKMKRLDAIIIIFLFIASFVPHVVYGVHLSTIDEDAKTIATVKINGEAVYSVELSEDTPHELKTFYPSEDQYNIIEVEGTRIRNKEDNSPDQLGVRKGWISRPGETAVVLPHKLIIEIHSESSNDDEEEIIIPL
ncbi:NusG domain II-containing protein [Marinilactibacillus kalidii]|uniref:NusG domain II-containing protein n=1 Tax=Marinilactibacillus kalidii TaxID=2820274 RepID=UPI001ABE9AE3|nr:NusG domain II-containing protein [Marinilactibacillus kalidii]